MKMISLLLIPIVLFIIIHVLREDQRVTTTLPGGRQIVKGPGLVLKLPGIHRDWQKHTVGDAAYLRTADIAVINDVALPVTLEREISSDEQLSLVDFAGTQGDTRFVVG